MSSRAAALLLDTHVWLWLVVGDETLPPRVRQRLEAAAARARIRVSAISVWEVALLDARGRIRLGLDCLAWVRAALAQPGVSLAPLAPEIAVASARLPGAFHGDPADRILIATAREAGATLVTRDARILDYGREGHLSVMPA
jgi:PIN domain nuclease of toxin-antitoxin system